MKRNHFLLSSVAALSVAGLLSFVAAAAAANDPKGTKPDQHQGQDNRTTKQKLEGPTKEGADGDFKELNKHAPGGPKASPAVEGSKSGGTGTGSGSGTGGASGGSGSGGSGSGGK